MEHLKSTPLLEFDWSDEPKALRDLYKRTNFGRGFDRFLAEDVIMALSPQQSVTEEHLIETLEKYICDLNEDSSSEELAQALERIQSLNQPNKICRRILKTGDVTFSCNDCGLDNTCVVCIDCFHKGAHKDHNYKMSNSDGGCCDCGDIEAWKQNYACTDHIALNQANLKLSDFEDKFLRAKQIQDDKLRILEKINRLPKSVATKYFLVCQASLHYSRMLLTWANYHSVPQNLEVDVDNNPKLKQLVSADSSTKNYFTVLFNDEVHTYDHVINTLVKIVKCTKMTASIMASTISREGRSLILNDNFKACKQVKDMIAQVRDSGQSPLKVEIIHGTVLAHQAFALKLIEWIQKMCSISDAFRILTAFTLLGTYDPTPEQEEQNPSDMTLIEKIMLSNTTYWKISRVEWNDLFVTSMLTEYSIKEKFARLLTRFYPRLMQDFIQDDHDHSVSILTLTTQLYTVPSLVCMLIEEENALAIISQTLIDTCRSRKRENPAISFENRNTFDMQGLKRGFYSIHDLKNLINIEPTKWTNQLRKNVTEAAKIFLDLLSSMQGMDPVRRQLGQHLEYEPDWESGMTLQSKLINLISRLITYCSFDEEVLVQALRETLIRLSKNGGYKLTTKKLLHFEASCIQYDVSTSPVSVHLPLTRFAAALVLELMKRRPSHSVPYDESLVMLNTDLVQSEDSLGNIITKQTKIDIMEPSLRTEVMIAQFRSGMWRRNGYSLVNQIMYAHSAMMRKEMFDRDILVLQECAAMCDANEYMMHLINKFNLFIWVGSDTTREPLVGSKAVSFHNDEEIMAQTMSLGEEFLQLLLTIVGERYRVGMGIIHEDDVIKNEIIQILCISPSTRSDLTQKLHVNDNELDCIKAVADLKRSTEASTGKYELKEEYYCRFNPFFYHYSRRNQSNALDAQLKRKKNLKEPLICCPPPEPVELTKQFCNLNELLKCDLTMILKRRILERALGPPENSQECSTKAPIRFLTSDLQLDQCLHLIGLGLYEQKRNPCTFKYLQAAHQYKLFNRLHDCYEKAKRSKDLIFWLMKQADELSNILTLTYFDKLDESDTSVIKAVKECFRDSLQASDSMKQDHKKRNSELAAQRRERIMAMMKANQAKFLSNPTTEQLVADTERNESPRSIKSNRSDDQMMDCESLNDTEDQPETNQLCILCRDEQEIAFDKPTMVLLAYIQRSAVLSKSRGERRIPNYALTPTNQLDYSYRSSEHQSEPFSFTSDNSRTFDATFMPSDLFFGPHISSCGHVMHYTCWQGFFDAIMKRETSRPNRNTRHVSFELEKLEILCPLCECISNATIPLLPNYTNFAKGKRRTIFSAKPEIILKSPENLSACLHALRSSVDVSRHIRTIKDMANSTGSPEDKYLRLLQPVQNINEVLEELEETEAFGLRDFINSVLSDKISSDGCTKSLLCSISSLAERIHNVGLDLGKIPVGAQHDRIFMMTSWSISYTIQTIERNSRLKNSSLFEDLESSKNNCLTFLLRSACSSLLTHQSDMMQSLLIRKLRYLLISEEHLSSSPCCLDIDAFEYFVSLFILSQKLYPRCSEQNYNYAWTTQAFDHEYFRNLLHLMLILNMLQVIITIHNEQQDRFSQSADSCSDEYCVLYSFYREVVLASGHPNNEMPLIDRTFSNRLKDRLLPFLRSCAIFFFHLSNIVPPELLRSKSKDQSTSRNEDSYLRAKEDEFDAICYYLDLPNDFNVLLKSKEARHLAKAWLRHSRVLPLVKSALKKTDVLEPTKKSLKRVASSQIVQQHQQKHQSQSLNSSASFSNIMTTNLSSQPIPSSSMKTELMPVKFIRQPHTVNRLIDLPYDYSELVDEVSDFTCPSIKNEDSRTPTMCLVCGLMLCSQSYCCQRDLNDLASNYQKILQRQQLQSPQSETVEQQQADSNQTAAYSRIGYLAPVLRMVGPAGAAALMVAGNQALATSSTSAAANSIIHQQLVGSCTYHAHECSGGVGVFLRIPNCQILLLSGRSKGCYMPAPYIDDHGETDFGLMRGNPLHLNRQHYEKLQQMWLTHAIPEQISRTLEYSPYASSINWHLH